jgi:cutinase
MRLAGLKPRAIVSLRVALAASAAFSMAPVFAPRAHADCPGAEVVFARGREEPPGLGFVGDALVNSLRGKTRMSVGAYGVNYPANINVDPGANDMSAHVVTMARTCPNTREVLGGYSLGAEVVDLATWSRIPPGMDQHVAAVALFGNGTRHPAPAYAGKTTDQCAPGDPICGRGTNWPSHLQPSYIGGGFVDQAASFVAGRL